MKFSVFTHVEHTLDHGKAFAYDPYVREMNLWFNHVNQVIIVAPVKRKKDKIETAYKKNDVEFIKVSSLNFTSVSKSLKSTLLIPDVIFKIFKTMEASEHIHIRCPGNIGLLACVIQIFFPKKNKTIKYAGNWDPDSEQPLSYRFQKWILSNTFLTKNAKVLVYGKWKGKSRNILPFFTASYFSKEIKNLPKAFTGHLKFLFVGTLTSGKQPLIAIKIIHSLYNMGFDVSLDIYGEGVQRINLKNYIEENSLGKLIKMYGNQNSEIIKRAYQESHFSILPSVSEGWPKALAEGMFYGCIPIATKVSCIPWMLDNGNRGILINQDIEGGSEIIAKVISQSTKLEKMSERAKSWAQYFTMERFELEIAKLL